MASTLAGTRAPDGTYYHMNYRTASTKYGVRDSHKYRIQNLGLRI